MRNIYLVILLFVSTSVWSDESGQSGFYVGGSAGFAQLDDDGMGNNLQSFDDNSGTFRGFGGYQFNPYFAAEVAMDWLGLYQGETATADIDNSYSSFTLSLIGKIPLGSGLSLFIQGGGGVASIYQVVDGTIGGVYYDDEDASNSGFATVWGGGLSYLIPNHSAIELRAGYLHTDFQVDAVAVNSLGNLVENEYDQAIKQIYFGAAYHF